MTIDSAKAGHLAYIHASLGLSVIPDKGRESTTFLACRNKFGFLPGLTCDESRQMLQRHVCLRDVFIMTARRYLCRCYTATVLMCLMCSLNQRQQRMCSSSLRPHVGES